MQLKGLNGTAILGDGFVTIKRTGFMARSTHGGGEVRIPVDALAAVEWRAPSRITNGYIAFVPTGGKSHQKRVGSKAIDAAKDPNAVTLQHRHSADAEAFRDAVDRARAGGGSSSSLDDVERLVSLHAAGHLSDDEFTAAKAKALGI